MDAVLLTISCRGVRSALLGRYAVEATTAREEMIRDDSIIACIQPRRADTTDFGDDGKRIEVTAVSIVC